VAAGLQQTWPPPVMVARRGHMENGSGEMSSGNGNRQRKKRESTREKGKKGAQSITRHIFGGHILPSKIAVIFGGLCPSRRSSGYFCRLVVPLKITLCFQQPQAGHRKCSYISLVVFEYKFNKS
jgi:hypothetical protein